MKILFVCTSNQDRSPALEKYFSEKYPAHEYRSAGINQYHCRRKETHYMCQEDADWADWVIFAEQIHRDIFFKAFYPSKDHGYEYDWVCLNLGEYVQGAINDEYLQKAEKVILDNITL
jgi:predicted protein tyrosine phosphatase